MPVLLSFNEAHQQQAEQDALIDAQVDALIDEVGYRPNVHRLLDHDPNAAAAREALARRLQGQVPEAAADPYEWIRRAFYRAGEQA